MNTSDKKMEVLIGKAGSMPPESDGPIFSLIQRFRVVVLTSPLWLAALMIGLRMYGGQRIHAVIDFLTGIAQ